jgi:hypothetical protein
MNNRQWINAILRFITEKIVVAAPDRPDVTVCLSSGARAAGRRIFTIKY